MSARNSQLDRARTRATEDRRRVLDEIRRSRISAGLSHAQVGQICHLSRSAVARPESGVRNPTLVELATIATVVGLDIRLRVYPAGDPIRDAGHARLLELLRHELAPGLRGRTEVPLPIEGDLRAWDAVISGAGWRLMVEAETVVDDVQALERRLARKLRDGGVDHCLLLVADTPRNRGAVAAAPAAFPAWPLWTRGILAELRSARRPAAGAIVFR
jgi:transcriptional regulator with XRE-family HTH domain